MTGSGFEAGRSLALPSEAGQRRGERGAVPEERVAPSRGGGS